jgi:predicted anti-sigma-YlaC factor YlaD
MPTERHAPICQLIDKSLAGAASAPEEKMLREHLATCTACSDYRDATARAIAGLEEIRFDVDPGLDRKVLAALALRAQQLETKQTSRVRLWSTSLLALLLTVVGSFAAAQLGGVVAAAFHIQPAQLQLGLTLFWITPSLCLCLLFVLLPMSPVLAANRKGLSL